MWHLVGIWDSRASSFALTIFFTSPALMFLYIYTCFLVPVLPVISWLLSLHPLVSHFRATLFRCPPLPTLLWAMTASVLFNPCFLQVVCRPAVVNSHPNLAYFDYSLFSVKAVLITFSSSINLLQSFPTLL